MVCQSLAQNDFNTIGCPGVQEAKQTIQDNNPDCLVIDWMLPDGSGIELVRWLRRTEAYSQTPILMLTARAQESDMITGLESGADDYLTKPFSAQELLIRIQNLIANITLRKAFRKEQLKEMEQEAEVLADSKSEGIPITERDQQ